MTGLGLGLGISSGGIGGGAVSFLYLMTQDGDILISQKNSSYEYCEKSVNFLF